MPKTVKYKTPKRTRIDPFTVFGAILVGGQTRLKLKKMYGILADFEPE